jgi:hypothetical protein
MPTFSRAPGVLSEVIDGRAALVSADGGEVITLNPVGTLVWTALEQAQDVEALVTVVRAQFPNAPQATVRNDVGSFLDSLCAGGFAATSEH